LKRTSALLLSALLALSVTGCGAYKQNDLTNNSTGTTTTGQTTTKTTTGTGTTGSTLTTEGTTGTAYTAEGTPGIANSNANTRTNGAATNQRTILNGATYGQMLRNARVNDTDGNLWDHENAVTRGNAY